MSVSLQELAQLLRLVPRYLGQVLDRLGVIFPFHQATVLPLLLDYPLQSTPIYPMRCRLGSGLQDNLGSPPTLSFGNSDFLVNAHLVRGLCLSKDLDLLGRGDDLPEGRGSPPALFSLVAILKFPNSI